MKKIIILLNLFTNLCWCNLQIANTTQKDCRLCHGPIAPQHNSKPPFNDFGTKYLRREIINNKFAPLYEYKATTDLYAIIRYNRFLNQTKHLQELRKRKMPADHKSYFDDFESAKHALNPELKISVRNFMRNLSKNFKSIRFDDLKLKTIQKKGVANKIYFQLKFDSLHLNVLPDFLESIQQTPYFVLNHDPKVQFEPNDYPYDTNHKHYYKVIQEGIVNYWEFDL